MPSVIDYAIFSAMPEELIFLQDFLSENLHETIYINELPFKIYDYNNKKILIGPTGLGTVFAASTVTLVYSQLHPSYMFFLGTAGGIKTGLKLHDVVIVEKAFEAEIQDAFTLLKGGIFDHCLKHPLRDDYFPACYSADESLLRLASSLTFPDHSVYCGTVVSSNTFPAPKELFEKIKSQNAYSIDMETSAFYQIAWLFKAKALAIRSISNVLNPDGSDDKLDELDIPGASKTATNVLLKILDALLPENNHPLGLINKFNLKPHPEGGHYSQIFQSSDEIRSLNHVRYNGESRKAVTSIYYLLNGYDFSAWHKLASDEIWHFYKGSPIKIYVIDKNGCLITHRLGEDIFQIAIPAGSWFAAEVSEKNSYGFIGCTVSPGFEFKDFQLADREILSMQFPAHRNVIHQFTRISNIKENIVDC